MSRYQVRSNQFFLSVLRTIKLTFSFPLVAVPLPMFSFTGSRGSIRGDVHFYGKQGVQFFTQLKTVTSNWPYHPTDLGGVTMPTVK